MHCSGNSDLEYEYHIAVSDYNEMYRIIEKAVNVKIPDADRARGDFQCVLGVIISSNNFITYP